MKKRDDYDDDLSLYYESDITLGENVTALPVDPKLGYRPDERLIRFADGAADRQGNPRAQNVLTNGIEGRGDLTKAVADAIYSMCCDRSAETRASNLSMCVRFFRYLDLIDPTRTLTSAGMLSRSMVNGYVDYLNGNHPLQAGASTDGALGASTPKYASVLQRVLDHIRTLPGCEGVLADDVRISKAKYQLPKGKEQKGKDVSTADVLTDSEMRAIHDACKADIDRAMSAYKEGVQLIAEGRIKLEAGAADEDARDMAVFAAIADRDFGGFLPPSTLIEDSRPALAAVLSNRWDKKIGGRRAWKVEDLRSCLHPTARTLVPFILVLAYRTFFNADPLLGLKNSLCQETHWLWGGLSWEVVTGDLSEAGRQQIRNLMGVGLDEVAAARHVLATYKGRSGKMVSRSFAPSPDWDSPPTIIEQVRTLTAGLRRRAAPGIADQLFLIALSNYSKGQPAEGMLVPQVFTDYRGAITAGSRSWAMALNAFRKEYQLPEFTLRSFRITGADVIYEATNGSRESARQILGHARVATTIKSYETPGNVKRMGDRLAVMTERRARMIRTKGQSAIAHRSCTPGFNCSDPYESPIGGQTEGRMCSAFPSCPICPHSSVSSTSYKSWAWLMKLEEALVDGAPYVDPVRYVAFYLPILDSLREEWLPCFDEEMREKAMYEARFLPAYLELE